MSDREYNGWTNHETWCVNLWLTNDQGSDSYWRERAQECWNDAAATTYATRAEMAVRSLAQELEDSHDEMRDAIEGLNNTVFADLLGAALGEVSWGEIAEHFIEDTDKSDETPAD